jgi:hypothetical protein
LFLPAASNIYKNKKGVPEGFEKRALEIIRVRAWELV